jgi:hypothetical protein
MVDETKESVCRFAKANSRSHGKRDEQSHLSAQATSASRIALAFFDRRLVIPFDLNYSTIPGVAVKVAACSS